MTRFAAEYMLDRASMVKTQPAYLLNQLQLFWMPVSKYIHSICISEWRIFLNNFSSF